MTTREVEFEFVDRYFRVFYQGSVPISGRFQDVLDKARADGYAVEQISVEEVEADGSCGIIARSSYNAPLTWLTEGSKVRVLALRWERQTGNGGPTSPELTGTGLQQTRAAHPPVGRELRVVAEDEEEWRDEPEGSGVHDPVSKATQKIMQEFGDEVSTIEVLFEKAEKLVCSAKMARREAEKARKQAEAARSRAEQLPQEAKQCLEKKEEELAGAKESLALVAGDLKTAEEALAHAEFSERAKRQEWEVVMRDAKARKAEVEALECIMARLKKEAEEDLVALEHIVARLKKEAKGAEHRAEVVTRELESNQLKLREKRHASEQHEQLLAEVAAAFTRLCQECANALIDFKTAELRQVRERRNAASLDEVVNQKLAEAEVAAKEWWDLHEELKCIGKRQRERLGQAFPVSNQLYTTTEEGLVQPAFLEHGELEAGEQEQEQELPPKVRAAIAKPLTQVQEAGPEAAASIQQPPVPEIEPELPSAPQTKIPTSAMPSPGMATPASGGIPGMGAGAVGTTNPRQNLNDGDRLEAAYQAAFGSPTKARSPAASEEPLLAQPVLPSVEAAAPPIPATLQQQKDPRQTPQGIQTLLQEIRAKPTPEGQGTLERSPAERQMGGDEGAVWEEICKTAGGQNPQEIQTLLQEIRTKPTPEGQGTLARNPAERQMGGKEGAVWEETCKAAGGQNPQQIQTLLQDIREGRCEAAGSQQERERERDAAREAEERAMVARIIEGVLPIRGSGGGDKMAEAPAAGAGDAAEQHRSMVARIIDSVLPVRGGGGREKKAEAPAVGAGDPEAEAEQGQQEGVAERQGQLGKGHLTEGQAPESYPAESAEPQKLHQSMIGRIIEAVLPVRGDGGGEEKAAAPVDGAEDPEAETEQESMQCAERLSSREVGQISDTEWVLLGETFRRVGRF